MKQNENKQFDPAVAAILHKTAGRWRVLIASIANAKPKIVATRDFPSDRGHELDSFLDEHNPGRVMCVIPASNVICRTSPLPDLPPAQMDQALHLQAEAHLLGIAPPHRTAMTVLPSAAGESSRSGLVLAWPESAEFDIPEIDRPMQFAPEVAALAAILGNDRPNEPVVWLDRDSRSVAMMIAHSEGTAFRATNEDGADLEHWRKGVTRALAETALGVGHSGAFVDAMVERTNQNLRDAGPSDAIFLLPESIRESASARVEGAELNSQWWNNWGVALGVLLASTGPLASLTKLRDEPEQLAQSSITRLIDTLSRPRTAIWAAAICLLILAFGPLVFSGLRLMVLNVRYADIQEKMQTLEEVESRLIMYEELEDRAWPMTKLIADIGNNTPIGVELETIRIQQGEAFNVAGKASPTDGKNAYDLIKDMQINLQESGIFNNVRLTLGDASAFGSYEFNLAADIRAPHFDYRYPTDSDFGLWTYQARIDGEAPPDGALASVGDSNGEAATDSDGTSERDEPRDDSDDGSETTAVVAAPNNRNLLGVSNADSPPNGEADDPRTPSVGTSNAGRRPPRFGNPGDLPTDVEEIGTRGPGGASVAQELPEMLTEAQIALLDKNETREQLAKVASAKKYYKGGDEETIKQLADQFNMLMKHLRDAS